MPEAASIYGESSRLQRHPGLASGETARWCERSPRSGVGVVQQRLERLRTERTGIPSGRPSPAVARPLGGSLVHLRTVSLARTLASWRIERRWIESAAAAALVSVAARPWRTASFVARGERAGSAFVRTHERANRRRCTRGGHSPPSACLRVRLASTLGMRSAFQTSSCELPARRRVRRHGGVRCRFLGIRLSE